MVRLMISGMIDCFLMALCVAMSSGITWLIWHP